MSDIVIHGLKATPAETQEILHDQLWLCYCGRTFKSASKFVEHISSKESK